MAWGGRVSKCCITGCNTPWKQAHFLRWEMLHHCCITEDCNSRKCCIRTMECGGSHPHVICSVWEVLIQLAMLAFYSLWPCQLALCPVPLASHLGCWISWYPDLLTIEAGLAHPAFHQRMACIWNLPWSVVISYLRWWCIQLYGPFSHCFLNDIWALFPFFLICLWYACILF